ncbi:MAG: rod shape-determining protein MreC [Acidobacteriota bacterium]
MALLAFLLIAHMIVVSLNRAPQHIDSRRFAQVWLLTALTPIQWATAEISSTVSNGVGNYLTLRDARLESEQLRVERADLQAKLIAAQEEVRLARQIQALQQWQSTQSYPVTLTRVIARDASQWFGTVVIDRGTIAGVTKDQPVVTPDGLVGRVIYAGPISARVLLLTDERHGAGAIIGQLAESRLLGVIKGKNESRCEMKFVATPEKIPSGELVLTSGQDGIYPRGLVIGTVRRTDGEIATSTSSIEVDPAVALDKLDLVGVLSLPANQPRDQVNQLVEAEKKKEKEKQDQAPRQRRR